VIGITFAGLNIDSMCRVLDGDDQPIPGLYAAGEVLGCIQGRIYSGGGMGIAGAVILGRHAGGVVGELVRQERAS
jgi:predicted oxidoreductase